jgi:hypothetical protein
VELSGLSPEAHGTLLALRDLREIAVRDKAIALELIERGYAELMNGKLRVTIQGMSARPFEQSPLDS